mgnify:CR=1 FL=1
MVPVGAARAGAAVPAGSFETPAALTTPAFAIQAAPSRSAGRAPRAPPPLPIDCAGTANNVLFAPVGGFGGGGARAHGRTSDGGVAFSTTKPSLATAAPSRSDGRVPRAPPPLPIDCAGTANNVLFAPVGGFGAVSYTHLTLPTTPYV